MTNQVKILHRTTPSTLLTSRLTAYRYISNEARSQIQSAIKSDPVVLLMKGTPAEPQCGFSRAVVQILDIHGVPADKMKTYNVLADDELRTAIKEFSLVPKTF
jgi:monothiol glutaredoxin